MSSVTYGNAQAKDILIIFLPGLGDVAEEFEVHGFVKAVTDSGLPADALAVDAHYGYYARRSVIDRLAHDIVLPARRRGYRELWLVGISMGGFGALSYLVHHAQHVERAVVLAPYLGEEKLVREIAQAQGVLEDERDGLTRAGHVRRVWDWIKRHEGGAGVGPRLYLGYGTRDRFAKASALLAAHLPPQHVLSIPGGHDWRTWKRLWDAFLQQWGSEGRHTLA